jgi:hypothetical protein
MAELRFERGRAGVDTRGVAKVIRATRSVNQLSENLGFFRERIAPEAVDHLAGGVDLRARRS